MRIFYALIGFLHQTLEFPIVLRKNFLVEVQSEFRLLFSKCHSLFCEFIAHKMSRVETTVTCQIIYSNNCDLCIFHAVFYSEKSIFTILRVIVLDKLFENRSISSCCKIYN